MTIKTLQWNIGGAKIRRADADLKSELSYIHEGLDYIAQVIQKHSPDIVTFQETHADKHRIQLEELAKKTSFPYWANDNYADSHVEIGQKLGLGIISQFPVENQEFKLFFNPGYHLERPDGSVWDSHDKGVGNYFLRLPDNSILEVQSTHLIPFRRYGIEPLAPEIAYLREDIFQNLHSNSAIHLLQGDFNYNEPSLRKFLPGLVKELKEVTLDSPTTPNDRWYDHVLYKGMKHKKSHVLSDTLTDHYPIYSEFKV